jgi:hypothetical protein
MRLTYLLSVKNRPELLPATIGRLHEITGLPRGQWEVRIIDNGVRGLNLAAIAEEFPGLEGVPGKGGLSRAFATCGGDYIIPLVDDMVPAGVPSLVSMVRHLHADRQIGAVTGMETVADGSARGAFLPTLVKIGTTCFRKSVLEKVGAVPGLSGPALDMVLSFKILAAGFRIDRRDDIYFQRCDEAPALEAEDDQDEGLGADKVGDLLSVARRYLPEKLSQIYWREWVRKYGDLSAHARKRKALRRAILRTRLRALHPKYGGHEPVSARVVESVFGLREQSSMIGEWARRSNAWRVVLVNFSDNLWATYNACRSSGLQMRCVADSHPAFEDMTYHELPIVPASRAFEGGGIDGAIITATDSYQIDATFRLIRAHFHGPILKVWQTPRAATHVRALAA